MKHLPPLFVTVLMMLGFTSFSQKNSKKDLSKYSKATFAAGCFWHEEALFESVKGVEEAVSGYAGGHTQDPNYESIESGNTGWFVFSDFAGGHHDGMHNGLRLHRQGRFHARFGCRDRAG